MPDKKNKTNAKRLSKGERKHVRRLKQEARKTVNTSGQPASIPAQK